MFSTAKNLLGWPLRCTFQYMFFNDIPISPFFVELSYLSFFDSSNRCYFE